jgi:hypothetical protein
MADTGRIAVNGLSAVSTIIQTVTVVAIFVGGFWAGIIIPISSRVEKVNSDLSERINRVESAESVLQVTLAEYREFHTNTDKTLENMRTDLAKLRDQQVTRGEHQQKWDADAAAFIRLQNEIDEIKRDFGSAYSLNDKIKELQTELNDIRRGAPK